MVYGSIWAHTWGQIMSASRTTRMIWPHVWAPDVNKQQVWKVGTHLNETCFCPGVMSGGFAAFTRLPAISWQTAGLDFGRFRKGRPGALKKKKVGQARRNLALFCVV